MIRTLWTRLTTAPAAALAAGLAAVHLVAAGLAFDPTPHSGGDNVAYLTLARSLLEHGAYLQLWDPAAGPHSQYPPGFPAILAGAMAVGISSWTALKALLVLVSGLAVALSYRWMRDRSDPGIALGAGLILAIAPGVVENSHWILSDVPFWAATMASLWFAARSHAPGAVGFAFAALLLRTAGLPLVLAVALWLALARRWRWTAAVVALLGALGAIWTMRARGSPVPYASDLWLANPYVPDDGTIDAAGLLARFLANVDVYVFEIFMDLLAGADGVAVDVIAATILALAAVGWVGRLRTPGVGELMLPLYLAMLLVWPAQWAADRLLLPVLPILLLLAAEGAAILPGRVPTFARAMTVALVLLLSAPPLLGLFRWGAACRAADDVSPSPCLHPDLRAFFALAAWTRDRLPPGSAVLSRKPTFFYYFGGVPGRAYPFTSREGALFEEAAAAGARYVVVDRLGAVSSSYLLPVVTLRSERFCAVQAIEVEGREAVLLGILPPVARRGEVGDAGEGGGDPALRFPVCPADYTR